MKRDVLSIAEGKMPEKRPSKETLNHAELIRLASGIDPFKNTQQAYLNAYSNLGIDIINRVPEENAPRPLSPEETEPFNSNYVRGYLGVYDTYFRTHFPFASLDEFWNAKIDLDYNKLITPVPHKLDKNTIIRKMNIIGEIGLYYYMLYTTLFMWGVEYLGWEIFLMAAALDPDGFDEKFLKKAFNVSYSLIEILSEIDSPFVFVHDDLADARGPVFHPSWYEKYIFPKYLKLWRPAKSKGKKIIFVADGNMGPLLKDLKDTGIDGVMLENPATDFDLILKHYGDSIIIGGIETQILSRGNPDIVKKHVREVYAKTRDIPGFAISTPGGIHGGLPIINLEAYFDERSRLGFTPEKWRVL